MSAFRVTLLAAASLALSVSAQHVEVLDPCDADPTCPQTVQIELEDICDNDPACMSDAEIEEVDPCSHDDSGCEVEEEIGQQGTLTNDICDADPNCHCCPSGNKAECCASSTCKSNCKSALTVELFLM